MLMKKLQVFFIGLMLVLQTSFAQEAMTAEKVLKNAYPSLTLLGFGKGNFTGSHGEEYVAYYEDPKQRYEKNKPPKINRVSVLVLKDGKLVNKYDFDALDVWSLWYDEGDIQLFEKQVLGLGKWNGYSYVGDFNSNGLDEILFFQIGGSFFLPKILEFNGREFRNLIDFESASRQLVSLEREVKDNQIFLRIIGIVGPNENDPSRAWFLYSWNAKSQEYILIDKEAE
jgi:hypothetical protein